MPVEFQRWNTHHSHIVPIEVCGHHLNIAQDPASDNLGTTIWDASVILVRYMEGNPHLYSRRKLQGKRVLELGAGCGLAGMYFALQGAHVTFTDLAEVVPLLRRNVTMNLGGQDLGGRREEGKGTAVSGRPQFEVLDYCWGDPLDALSPPYDYVIACDCVYAERLVESLVWSLARVSARGTTVIVASERREENTYAKFRARLGEMFTVKQAPRRHMDAAYDHDMSEVLLCKLRRAAGGGAGTGGALIVGENGGKRRGKGGGRGRGDPLAREGGVEAQGRPAEGVALEKPAIEGAGHSVASRNRSTLEASALDMEEQSPSRDSNETTGGKRTNAPRAEDSAKSAADVTDGLSLAGVSLPSVGESKVGTPAAAAAAAAAEEDGFR